MNTVSIETSALKALMLFIADKKDPRYYLRSVHLETGPEGARLTATDGHTLLAHFIPGDYIESTGIIPFNILDTTLKTVGRHSHTDIEVTPSSGPPNYKMEGISAPGIDRKYPDIQRIIPQGPYSGDSAQFDAEYTGRFSKAAKLLGKGKYAPISYNGNQASLVDVGRDDFFGVIMPVRKQSHLTELPMWAIQKLNPPADTAPAPKAT